MTNNAIPPELEFADNSDDERADKRQGRVRMIAWIAIGALLVSGGGATVAALIFG